MINKLFNSYIELSSNILSAVKNGIAVDEFFDKRQNVINSIIELDISKDEKKRIYESSGAENLDKNIVEYIQTEMKNTKSDMKRAIDNKKVYSSYVSNNMSGSFFRRTI